LPATLNFSFCRPSAPGERRNKSPLRGNRILNSSDEKFASGCFANHSSYIEDKVAYENQQNFISNFIF
jgi:hypothetical protein